MTSLQTGYGSGRSEPHDAASRRNLPRSDAPGMHETHAGGFVDSDRSLTRLVYAYIACFATWLVFGTLIGECLGIRVVWPDLRRILARRTDLSERS